MGLFDFLKGKPKFVCPSCGNPRARQDGLQTRCPNPECQYFDLSLYRRHNDPRRSGAQLDSTGRFSPSQPVGIRYRNFQGKEKSFTGDAATARRKRNHISMCVAPTGERITLARDRILNLQDLEARIPALAPPVPAGPTPRERQVLNYHKKYGTTSPLYEQIRARYPDR